MAVIGLMDEVGMGKCSTVLGSPDEENRDSVAPSNGENGPLEETEIWGQLRICPFDSALCDVQQCQLTIAINKYAHVSDIKWNEKKMICTHSTKQNEKTVPPAKYGVEKKSGFARRSRSLDDCHVIDC